ncbi:hypothetical protein ACEWY4_001480 [Coilia grayii]|uniref:Uncharacterized protein n=1 Tax=Coilia grayii TaxID=363190 RepID=A0ABD1KT36_9TELE
MTLFSSCHVPTCGAPIIDKKVSTRGSKIKIEWTCLNYHSRTWTSCHDVRGVPENNLLFSAATLFSGSTYTEIAEWASILNLQILKSTQFYSIQRENLIPVLHFAYKDQQDYLIKRLLREKAEGKCGDARCDSPEAGSSVAMECQGFRRSLNHLIYNEGLPIDLITTDRAPSIRKMMREEFGNIHHEFDPWHELRRRWTSLLHHICGEHVWEQDGRRWACPHPALSPEEQRKKRWLHKDSDAFRGLQAIVEDKRLLKDLNQMTHFKHTGSLEVFHSVMLKYMPKCLHFDYDTMVARTQLAILDNNYNVGREQAMTSEGIPRFSMVFTKHSKDWVAKKIYEPTSQSFRHHLVQHVLQRRENPTPPEIPRVQQPQNIATKEKPPKEDVIQKHQSRFSSLLEHHNFEL